MAVRSLPWSAPEPARRRPDRYARLLKLAGRIKAPAPLKRLAEMPLFVAGLGFIDWGVFTQSVTAGLIVAGLSLIGLEYLIADRD